MNYGTIKIMGSDEPLLNILVKTGTNLLSNTPKERKEASPNLILTVNQLNSERLKGSGNTEATLYIHEKFLDTKQSQHCPVQKSDKNVPDTLKKE